MDHISTAGMYQSALLNLFQAENRQSDAAAQISSGKVASDLEGFGGTAEKLTATKSLYARTQNYLDNATVLSGKLDMQDQALTQLGSASQGARDAIANALATGNAAPLMTSLQNQMSAATGALNLDYQGSYLFAGGQTGTPPFAASNLSDLTAAPSVSSLFKNDQLTPTNRLDDNTVASTGFLASNIGQPLMQALQAVEAYSQGPNGPLNGQLTSAQSSFLQGVLSQFDSATSGITDATSQNGVAQTQLQNTQTTLQDQQTTLQTALGNMTDADMAQAATNLQLAQVAVQASAQVFSALKGSSLLQTLSTTA
jgi:flagellar hook-associated protein 3 FlgL